MDKSMARYRQPISSLLPGAIAVTFITAIVFMGLISLWQFAFNYGEQTIVVDNYLWRVLSFTFIQALLSSSISILLAIIFAKALYQSNFKGKLLLLRLLSVTFVLPSLVVVTGLIAIYGQHGWLMKLCSAINIDYSFSIYGFSGIIIAHVFLNFPFASRICYQSLMLIPNEQKQLSEQIGLSYWQQFRYLELPNLYRVLLPVAGLIFMLCFSSFAIVLALSGGPKYTTIEVAIYQAIRDFELYQAVILSAIQLLFCLSFMFILTKLTPRRTPSLLANKNNYQISSSKLQTVILTLFISLACLFIFLPLLAIIVEGLWFFSLAFLTMSLFKALLTSITVAFCSATTASILAIALLWTNSRLRLVGYNVASSILMLLGTIILAIPSMVLAAGWYILFFQFNDVTWMIFVLVVISNSLLALPFILKNLEHPITDLTKQYHLLASSLNIEGFNYLRLIEFKALKRLFTYSFVFSAIMSMGDFGIVALFGSQDFATLPYILYQQVSFYRFDQAAFTSFILLLMSLLLIFIFEYPSNDQI